MKPAFRLGRTLITPAALEYTKEHVISPTDLLDRHVMGDCGDMEQEDIFANVDAITSGEGRIFSSYKVGPEKIWIITADDRSHTTIMLPSDY